MEPSLKALTFGHADRVPGLAGLGPSGGFALDETLELDSRFDLVGHCWHPRAESHRELQDVRASDL